MGRVSLCYSIGGTVRDVGPGRAFFFGVCHVEGWVLDEVPPLADPARDRFRLAAPVQLASGALQTLVAKAILDFLLAEGHRVAELPCGARICRVAPDGGFVRRIPAEIMPLVDFFLRVRGPCCEPGRRMERVGFIVQPMLTRLARPGLGLAAPVAGAILCGFNPAVLASWP